MGIYGALATAITGLRAQSFSLEHISGNIANAQTTGYKRTETNFVDLIPDAPPTRQTAGAVVAFSRATNEVQGDIQTSDNETFMAINGEGYFVVSQKVGQSDGQPVFDGTDLYTRRGDFQLDKNGYLVNGAGYFLQGLAIDNSTGNIAGSTPSVIRVSNDFLPAKPTTEVTYRANLARFPLTATADSSVPGSELLNLTAFSNDPRASGDGFVRGDDVTDFLEHSVAGGAITAFDASGAPVNLQLRWAKIESATSGGGAQDVWNLFYMTSTTATGATPAWQNVGTDYTFGGNGQLNPPITDITIDVDVDGVTIDDLIIRHGTDGLTQFADADGTVQLTDLAQNGYSAGELVGIAISDSGRVTTTYSNGQIQEIAAVALAGFNADNALRKLDGGVFQATNESGQPIIGATGSIIGSSLEASNVDIADEFTKLIVTQQAYAAATRIVSTSDEMLQEALNMIR
ncbi:MAG: flagellar hook-basal body complex protein [Hyphomicrobiaceae bacterium]|nr:flagellar hook-basal body complex protein [Hyphomicrobiaceae bacterium]